MRQLDTNISNKINSKYTKKSTYRYKSQKFSENYSSQPYGKFLFNSIFSLIILVLFAIAFSNYIRTGQFINFSFKSLLDYLSRMPDVSVTFSRFDLTIPGPWPVLDFFRSILNYFTGCFEILITLSGFMIQGLVVIFYMFGLFFI